MSAARSEKVESSASGGAAACAAAGDQAVIPKSKPDPRNRAASLGLIGYPVERAFSSNSVKGFRPCPIHMRPVWWVNVMESPSKNRIYQ